jgi:N-methylhydantoinase A
MRFGEVEGEAPTYAREDLGVGANVVGPAVIDGRVETIVVPPGWQAAVDDVGSLVLTFETR